jgi:hypothetical protein
MYEAISVHNDNHSVAEVSEWLAWFEKRPDFFAVAVKTLCITNQVSCDVAQRVLDVCSRTTALAIWLDDPQQQLSKCIRNLRIRQLSMEFTNFHSLFTFEDKPPSWYDNLTHLVLIFWEENSTGFPSLVLPSALPALTHLCLHSIPSEYADRFIDAAEAFAPRLSCVIFCTPDEFWEEHPPEFRARKNIRTMAIETNIFETLARRDDWTSIW